MKESPVDIQHIDFYFDPMCPWAYQTSLWIREVRRLNDLEISWKFFSLEEINLVDGKKHPWERDLSYGWTPMRIGAWLRRSSMSMCDDWYGAIGRALHVDGRRPYERDVAIELLGQIHAPPTAWDDALADPTTHDEVRADHDRAVGQYAGFGVPILVFPSNRAMFGPVVVPAPMGDEALKLWELAKAYNSFPGLFEIKTPKTGHDRDYIAAAFTPYLVARQWKSVQNSTP
ncbi:MAG: DsbA family protein [Ilumatobacteraceae bacterium]